MCVLYVIVITCACQCDSINKKTWWWWWWWWWSH